MRKIIIISVILGIFFGMKTFVFKDYHNGKLFGQIKYMLADGFYGSKALYNIAKFDMPEGYQFLRWMEAMGGYGPKYTAIGVFGKEKKLADTLILYKVPLHSKVNPLEVKVIRERPKNTYFKFMQSVWDTPIVPEHDVVYVLVRYYMPFFWRLQDNPENRTLILRGLDHTDYKEIETDKIWAYIWYGNFREIFFDKKPDGLFRYWITSLYFQQDRHGAVMLVQDKKTEATFFVVQSSILSIPVDREKFEKFIKSIDFDTKIYDPNVKLEESKKELAKKGIKLSTFTVKEK